MAFRDFSKYRFGFSMLDVCLSEPKQQTRYFCRWMEKYAAVFKSNDNYVGIEWDLRCRKTLQEIFASANFYVEAKKCLEMQCISSYYFCMYYSLFHAIYATLFLDNQACMKKLLNITHKNLITTFIGTYANSRKDILSKEIIFLFEKMKYKREYYSYTTPFNNIFELSEDINQLETILFQCYQLCSFHSLMVEKSYKKNIGKITRIKSRDELFQFEEMFKELFSKKDLNGKSVLDPASLNIKNELLTYGFSPEYIALGLDHQIDEFHTYDSAYKDINENALKISDIWSVLFGTLHGK